MTPLFDTYLHLFSITFLFATLCFVISVWRKRNDIADVAWGMGFVLVSVVSFLQQPLRFDRGFLATALVTLWAVRLSAHIYSRNRKRSEDYRYKAWREAWGKTFYWRSFLQVYLLQGCLMLCVVSPVIIINVFRGGTLTIVDSLGVLIWLTGFIFETVGDWQLHRFSQNPANTGKIIQSGLWRYSRHPNYFGEVTQWWGLWVITLSVPFGFWGLLGPATITFLILKVSGIPMLEKKYEQHPEFLNYKQMTNAFFPWWPKKKISIHQIGNLD